MNLGRPVATTRLPFYHGDEITIIYAMTTRQIEMALRRNECVVLRDDPWKWVRRDLFGDLVVVDIRHSDEPVRKVTLSDKRRAVIQGMTMPKKKQTL